MLYEVITVRERSPNVEGLLGDRLLLVLRKIFEAAHLIESYNFV